MRRHPNTGSLSRESRPPSKRPRTSCRCSWPGRSRGRSFREYGCCMRNENPPKGIMMTKQEQLLNELVECEIQRRQLEQRAAALREHLGLSNTQSRHISAAGRERIAAAQRARWAAAKEKKAERRGTPQSAALKKRWAAFHAGTGPRPGAKEPPRPERKKVKWTPAMRKAAAERMRRVNNQMAKNRAATKAAAA